jgi:hypothetical protein
VFNTGQTKSASRLKLYENGKPEAMQLGPWSSPQWAARKRAENGGEGDDGIEIRTKETIMIRHMRQAVLGGIVLAATLAWSASPSQAVSISCVGAGDVTLLGPAGCDLGPLHFDQFAVSAQGQHN